MQRKWLVILFLVYGLHGFPQELSVVVTATDNTDCIGRNCFYNGPTILINEVMLSPTSHDGSIAGGGDSRGGEWIELYNPHKCDSVDISCYFLGNNAPDGGNYGGGFSIPPGSIVPPQGFALIRGINTEPLPDSLLVQNGGNVVDIVVSDRYCVDGGIRLWFPNAGGWFAFYDANGIPQDAISWNSTTNSCMSCPPCDPEQSDCILQNALPSYDEIPSTRKTYISSLNPQSSLYIGNSFRRIPDGGVWQSTPSAPTYGTCNDICIDPPESSCNAIAVAVATGGVPPYTYQWDDNANQTTDTAFALCAGTYTVTVTDANLDTVTAQVTVVDFIPYVSHDDLTYCISDSSAILSGYPTGGEYEGGTFSDNTFFFQDSAAVYPLIYTITDTNGCSASIGFTVTLNPTYDTLILDTICQRLPYDRYDFHLSSEQTDTVGTLIVDTVYQTVNHCDSTVHLELFVLPSEILTYDTAICENEDFAAYGLYASADTLLPGFYQYITTYENQYGCDSTETVNLTVHPVYNLLLEETICQGEVYDQNGFFFHTDTMTLGLHQMVHHTETSEGCDSTFTLIIDVLRSDETIIFDTICQYNTYHQYNFELSEEEVEFVGDFVHFQNLQNKLGCDSTVRLNLAVTTSPVPDFVANPERSMFSDQIEIQFLNITDLAQNNSNVSLSWQWDFGDGELIVTNGGDATHRYSTWGEYLVTLTVVTEQGCEGQISHNVYIEADLFFPNIITPNGDHANDVFAIGNLNPNVPNCLTIYDRWGKKVFEKENYQTYFKDGILYNEEMGFTGQHLSDGVYFYVFRYIGLSHSTDYHSTLTIIR